jgi:site-specific recombinase XerD
VLVQAARGCSRRLASGRAGAEVIQPWERRAGKGGKTRVLPIIDDEFLSDLKHLIGPRTTGPIFSANGHQVMSLRLVNHIGQRVGEHAGVANPNPGRAHLNPHIFHHSIAPFLKSKGFSAEWSQNFLGHQSYQTTMDMYGTISIDEMQEIAAQRHCQLNG